MKIIKTILHIGIGKAGSSTIQSFLSERREELINQNIFYPFDIVNGNKLGGDNHKCLAMISIEYNKANIVFKQQRVSSKQEKDAFNQRVLKLYAGQLKNLPENVICILSAEHFWSVITKEQSIIRLKQNLETLNLQVETIVLYIRDQVKWLKSYTLQKLIEGSTTSLEIPFKDDQAIRARLDYFETIKLWKYGFPKANIVPRIFDPEEFKGGNLVYDFFSVFAEGDISQYYTDFEKVFNVSDLNLEGYLLLAMFNNYGKASISKYGTYTSSRKAIMEYLRTEFSGKPADFYTKDFALHIRDIFKDSNEKVRQEYFSWRKSLFDDSYIEYLPTLPVARQLSSAKLIKYLYNAILSFKDYQSNC
jgi:hypothetical protein